MGMTIDESNRILIDRYIDTYVVCGGENYNPAINITRQDFEAFQVAIHIMRKYKKIEEILDQLIDSKIRTYDAVTTIEDIVFGQAGAEDGNDD